MLHKRSAKIDNHKSKRMKIEKIFKSLYNASKLQMEDNKATNNPNVEDNAEDNAETNVQTNIKVNMNNQQIPKFQNGFYINYNYLPKVNCTITNSKYIDDLVEYFVKWNHYKSLASVANLYINNDKIHNMIIKNMEPTKIINVITIYIDYPFYTTIKIDDKLKQEAPKKSSFNFNLSIYRELLSKDASQIGQIENILKSGNKENNSETIIVDFYNILIFLYKIIFDSDSSFITKKELLCFIKNDNITRSIYTDYFVHTKTINCMNILLYLLLENIQVEQY